MEPNTQKGCLIGCLVSAGILVASTVLVVFAIALVVRGCAEMGADAMEEAVNTPQDANQFKKVWLSGDGEDAEHILKIRLHGIISSTVEHGIFETIDDTSAPTALRKIKAATKDKSIRGIYLDIDSPGGGVTMSDELHNALVLFRESADDRFVFVHMGDLCCSGGYYTAAPADWIMARPTSLTGSIGVIMSTVNLSELARKVGIEGVTIASGENKDILNPLKPVNPEHVKILEEPVRQLYNRFVEIVAHGRKLPVDTVRHLADGRIFSAQDAMKNRLVDSIGHENDALEQIKKLAGKDVRIYGYRKKNDFLSIFENSFLLESSDGFVRKMKSALQEEETPRAEYRMR